jgi:hypothetical protein
MRSGRARSPRRGAALIPLALLFGACDHSTPFTPPDTILDEPLIDGNPVQLTYGASQGAAWTPDGAALVFPFRDGGRSDGDVCLGLLPASGGTIVDMLCHEGPRTTDTLDALRLPAVSPALDVAFVRSSGLPNALVPRERWLAFSPLEGPHAETRVRFIPFQSASGTQLTSLAVLRWLGDDRLAFIANAEEIVLPCDTCDPIVVESGRALIVADLSGAAPQLTEIPTAGNPIGLAVDGDDLYYVLAGDARVYRQTGVAGAPVVVHDFAPHALIRGIDVADGRLVAIANGLATTYETDAGTVLEDGPGELYLVDLGTGETQSLTRTGLRFEAPALRPGGDAVAVTGVPVRNLDSGAIVVDGPGNIWMFGQP